MLKLRYSILVASAMAIGFADAAQRAEVEPVIRKPLTGIGSAADISIRRTRELSIKSQCGVNWDAQQVEQYNGALGPSQAFVGRHESRVGYHVDVGCTGTLISDDLFLSAGHCGYAVGHRVRFDYQNAPDGTTARPSREFSVSQVVEQENSANWDYAIVRLNGNPGREFGHANIAAIDPPAGSQVTIIGHPATRPKEIHSATVFDYASPVGSNWFRHQIDTVGGNSGSGVLNADGQVIGVHTNAGCNTSGSIQGNSAMRMSQLVTRSPTLQALTRNKILWRNTDGAISLWRLDAAGNHIDYRVYGPYAGWTPVSYANNRILWRHTDGRISYWVLNEANVHLSYAESGPYAGWTAVNHANDRVLWRHTDGRISLWTVNNVGNYLSHREYGPYAGWTAAGYANNRILWRHNDGRIVLWRLDDNNDFLAYSEYGPYAGWTAMSYANGELTWHHTGGTWAMWSMNRSNGYLSGIGNGPYGGWTPVATADRKLMWHHTDGRISFWTINSDGVGIGAREHGPFAGWTAMFTTGSAP
jgi:V8-like Glu-specific endopeptidase